MAEKTLNTRIILKNDTFAALNASTFIPKKGEIVLAQVTAVTQDPINGTVGVPTYMIKVGNGTNKFSDLQWVAAPSADVHDWAKATTKPTYAATEISGLQDYISGKIQDTNTTYTFAKDDNGNLTVTSSDGIYTNSNIVDATLFDAAGSATAALNAAKTYTDQQIAAIDQTDYSLSIVETTPENYAKTYTFSQEGNTIATINIPKDMVVESGSIVTNPEGQTAGTYIELTLANTNSDKLYINVGDLIEYVTGSTATDGIITTSVDVNHILTATINDGTLTKAKLSTTIQSSLDKADSALQSADIGTAAEKNVEYFATAAQGLKADSALQNISAGTGLSISGEDNNVIGFDDTTTFIFDCGTATTQI